MNFPNIVSVAAAAAAAGSVSAFRSALLIPPPSPCLRQPAVHHHLIWSGETWWVKGKSCGGFEEFLLTLP